MATFAATMTGLRGIGRIDEDDRHTSGQRLVGDELPQLVEAPAMVPVTPRLAASSSLADTFQVFQSNGSVCLSGLVDDAAADDVVDVCGVLPFAARQPLQEFVGGSCAFALHGSPYFRVVVAESVHLRCFMNSAIALDSNPALAKIDTEDALSLDGIRRWFADLDVQEVTPILALDQRGRCRALPLESFALSLPDLAGQPLSGVEQGQGESPIAFTEGKDPGIVVDTGRVERRVDLVLDLEGSTDAANGPYGQVSGQTEQLPHFLVAGVLKDHLVRRLFTPGDFGDVVAGRSERLKSGIDFRSLFRCRVELTHDGSDSLHKADYIHMCL